MFFLTKKLRDTNCMTTADGGIDCYTNKQALYKSLDIWSDSKFQSNLSHS